jgi:hypothetical protein
MAAAGSQDLPPPLMVGILKVEGGRVGTEHENSNGTRDLGPMQINTLWVSVVAKAHGLGKAEVERSLRDDGCYNAHMAAWILKRCMNDLKDFWTGVGCYHSRTPALNKAYQQRVKKALEELYGRPHPALPSLPRLTEFKAFDGPTSK